MSRSRCSAAMTDSVKKRKLDTGMIMPDLKSSLASTIFPDLAASIRYGLHERMSFFWASFLHQMSISLINVSLARVALIGAQWAGWSDR